MIVVPADTPFTTPVEPIVATAVFDDDQVPPDMVSVKVAVLPIQIEDAPEIDKEGR